MIDCGDYVEIISRGHTVKATTESFKMSKDAGFKVVTHMMPDLPNVGLERDIEQFIVSLFVLLLLFCFLVLATFLQLCRTAPRFTLL